MSTQQPPIRVMLVDDDPRVIGSLEALLGTYPQIAVVGTAADGEKAISLALGARPDVVLMDVIMPGIDGIEATRRLKRLLPATRVVLLTTYGSVEHDAARSGADAMLMKTDSDEEIIDTICRQAHHQPPPNAR